MFDRAAAFAIAAMLIAVSLPARAQTIDFNHVVSVVGSQATTSQIMAKEALLVALNVQRGGTQIQSLDGWHRLFDRTLTGLREGDDILGLPAAATPEIAADLDVAASHWQSFGPAFREGVSTGSLSAEQVSTIATHSVGLMQVLEAVAMKYAEESNRNRLTSMLLNAQLEAIHGTLLSQRMATEYLLIAYGHEAEASRTALAGSIAEFDTVLRNLTSGNLERRLLPPPNDRIREELVRAMRTWEDEFRPIIRRALDDGSPPADDAAGMVAANDMLLEHMNTLTSLYVGL